MSASQFFTNLVPPPAFISMPSVGIDISDTSIKYMQFELPYKRSQDKVLIAHGDVDIPAGAFDRGEVVDEEATSAVLHEIKSLTGIQYARVSLPEERAYIFETHIKKYATRKEIEANLEFRLQEHVPLSPRDAYFDYKIVGETKKGYWVVVVVYARKIIMGYYNALQKASIIPISFEVEAQAIARAAIPTHDTSAHMVVDFGKTRTGIGIVYKDTLFYTSTIDIGGTDISERLRKHLGDLPESELTTIKNTEGLIPKKDNNVAYEVLLAAVSEIKDEIASRLHYWHSLDHGEEMKQIKSIILCGGSANMRGLPEYFSETLGVTTSRVDVWQNVLDQPFVPEIERRFSYGYATAIGLALKTGL